MSKRHQTPAADPAKPEKEFASWFKSLRKHSLNLTQKELAERTGIPLGTIRYFEQTGRTSLQNFLRIATQLHALDFFLSLARGQEPVSFQKIQKEKTISRLRDELAIQRNEANREPTKLTVPASLLRQSTAVTLAAKLGTVPHLSPLLQKRAKHGLKAPEQMAACAVGRGCRHYANMPKWKDSQPLPAPEISNEELAIGLLSACHPYEPLLIRVGSQLLSAPDPIPKPWHASPTWRDA